MPFRQRLHQAVRGDERQVQDGLFAILRYICQYHLTASQISGYALVNQFVSKCETTFLFPASPFPPASTQTSVKIFDNIDCTQTQNKQLKMKKIIQKMFIETNENGTEAVVDRILFFQLKEKVVCVFVLVRFEWNWIDFVSNCSFYDYILAHQIVKYFQYSIPRTLLLRYLA
ncbi:Serpin_superfamily [Hexamita inflata]|uniref:Serpin superfamily n=1 Tax=Hexamita inflata TaxID=28002 RepID=A0AA86QFS7_9EUKA|nr:Serpin superfamily [Hexamita inflata]